MNLKRTNQVAFLEKKHELDIELYNQKSLIKRPKTEICPPQMTENIAWSSSDDENLGLSRSADDFLGDPPL